MKRYETPDEEREQLLAVARKTGKSVTYIDRNGVEVTITPNGFTCWQVEVSR